MNKRNAGQQQGQTLIEFAIVLPVLLLIVFVIFDLGRAIYTYSMLTNAAREGARYASVASTASTTDIQQHTLEFASGVDVQITNITVDKNNVNIVEVENNSIYRDDINVIVTINYNFVPITPYVSRLLNGGVLDLSTSSRMGREYR
jgi:Flp pilus assembly protein TadG